MEKLTKMVLINVDQENGYGTVISTHKTLESGLKAHGKFPADKVELALELFETSENIKKGDYVQSSCSVI